jgi:hypothetical protein
MISRREMLSGIAAEIGLTLMPPIELPVTLEKIVAFNDCCLWMAGPPGRRLQRFVEALAWDACGVYGWPLPEDHVGLGDWEPKIRTAGERPVAICDRHWRGDMWTSAESRLASIARTAGVKLEFK